MNKFDEDTFKYWKLRLKQEEQEALKSPHDIRIVPETLRWFIETIEYLRGGK